MKEKIEISRFDNFVDAICYWFGYQVKLGRDKMLNESSLRFPIAEVLTSGDINVEQIILEKLHPLFKSKRLDLVVYSKNSIEDVISEAYEFKIAKYTSENSIEHQRVFDDIVRLAYLNKYKHVDTYFLMCGRFDEFKQFFVGDIKKLNTDKDKLILNLLINRENKTKAQNNTNIKGWNSKGIYKDWFSFSKEDGENIKILDFESKISKKNVFGLSSFKSRYKLNTNINSFYKVDRDKINFKTICIAITPYNDNLTYAAGVWKIEAIKD